MNLNTNVNFFLGLQTQLRINHWQTKGHARHSAFGDTYSKLNDLIDEYVEQSMGKYGRFILDDETKNIQLVNLSELDIKSFINTVTAALIQFTDELDKTDTNLLNIRDEMLGEMYKLSYLLTQE
jgi:DNA-binding ferritin-like protein